MAMASRHCSDDPAAGVPGTWPFPRMAAAQLDGRMHVTGSPPVFRDAISLYISQRK